MKARFIFLLAATILAARAWSTNAPATSPAPVAVTALDKAQAASGVTYVIPVQGMIERGLLYVFRRGFAEAERKGATAIVLHINTPGGQLGVTEEIVRMLSDPPAGMKVYAFIDKDALSAGSLIAVCADEVYMAPGSRMGASAIVSMFGDVPDGDMKEKLTSATVALVARAAERKGHDPKLVEAMIRKDAGYKIGDEEICPKGQLLTLTDSVAAREVLRGDKKEPILSSGTCRNLDELIALLGRKDLEVITVQTTWSEDIARWIEALGAIFLIGGLLGLYIEFKTPGFGLPGILGIVCLGIFFWGHKVAGLAGMEEMLIFLIGLILIGVEIFLIPGHGVAGVVGMLLVMLSVMMAMMEHLPGDPWYRVPTDHIGKAFMTLGGSLVVSAIGALLLARFLPSWSVFRRVTLETENSAAAGFLPSDDSASLVGLKGTAITDLRPAGTGMFGERQLTIVTHGDYISRGTPIVIVEVSGNRIVADKS